MLELQPCPPCGNTNPKLCEELGYGVVECRVNDCFTKGPMKDDIRQAVAAWNALPRPLRWTNEPPTEPGWYFCQRICKDAENQYPLRVVHIHYDVVMGKRTLCYGGCAW